MEATLSRTQPRSRPVQVGVVASGMDDAHLAHVGGYMGLGALLYLLWAHRSRMTPRAAQ